MVDLKVTTNAERGDATLVELLSLKRLRQYQERGSYPARTGLGGKNPRVQVFAGQLPGVRISIGTPQVKTILRK